MGGVQESPWRWRECPPAEGTAWVKARRHGTLEGCDWAAEQGGGQPLKCGGKVMGSPGASLPDRSSSWEGEAAPGPLILGKTHGQAELILEIFIDQVKFTITLKFSLFLLERKKIKKEMVGRGKINLH